MYLVRYIIFLTLNIYPPLHTHSYCRCSGLYSVNSIGPSTTLLDLYFHLLPTGWMGNTKSLIAWPMHCNLRTVFRMYIMCASNSMHEFCLPYLYMQLAPYVTDYFPESFETVGEYVCHSVPVIIMHSTPAC